ncbi:hypothetical protein F2P81_020261 [Scophthalmus maximus]|uniref:Uncharacterized protein n=1 Tax=Scophthalmus maximus TaxID=52904 RepID=A0A6A4S7I8_SCOMX|nr:hypothetical protein F2P81_020261 [Scophthalmus maximus]
MSEFKETPGANTRRCETFPSIFHIHNGSATGSSSPERATRSQRELGSSNEKPKTSILHWPAVGSCGQCCANSRKLRRVKGNGTSNARGQQAAESHTAAERKMK